MSMKNPTIDVCVVGGGAAGMMAAITAAECGSKVLVLERNDRPLRKLMITGKGRCNLTNDCGPEMVMQNTVHNGRFLFSALHAFPPAAVMEYFIGLGVSLKTERGNRVFPVSDRAADVADALTREGKRLGVRIACGRAEELRTEAGGIREVVWEGGSVQTRTLILATGGLSYPLTGSSGDGYRLAESLGHRIVPCRASLVPLVSPDQDCAEMQGLSLRNVRLSLLKDGRSVWQEQGEMQFTHFGVTGPLALSASAHMSESGRYQLELDMKPALDDTALDRRLLRDFKEKQPDKPFRVLNLFAYTGGATCALAAEGAEVVHVDAAKSIVQWAKANLAECGLADRPVRFIVDDCMKFVEREARRGKTYDAVGARVK